MDARVAGYMDVLVPALKTGPGPVGSACASHRADHDAAAISRRIAAIVAA